MNFHQLVEHSTSELPVARKLKVSGGFPSGRSEYSVSSDEGTAYTILGAARRGDTDPSKLVSPRSDAVLATISGKSAVAWFVPIYYNEAVRGVLDAALGVRSSAYYGDDLKTWWNKHRHRYPMGGQSQAATVSGSYRMRVVGVPGRDPESKTRGAHLAMSSLLDRLRSHPQVKMKGKPKLESWRLNANEQMWSIEMSGPTDAMFNFFVGEPLVVEAP